MDTVVTALIMYLLYLLVITTKRIIEESTYMNLEFLRELTISGESQLVTPNGLILELSEIERSRIINYGVEVNVIDNGAKVEEYQFCIGFGMRDSGLRFDKENRKDIKIVLKDEYRKMKIKKKLNGGKL